jgi:hypothetical protein
MLACSERDSFLFEFFFFLQLQAALVYLLSTHTRQFDNLRGLEIRTFVLIFGIMSMIYTERLYVTDKYITLLLVMIIITNDLMGGKLFSSYAKNVRP